MSKRTDATRKHVSLTIHIDNDLHAEAKAALARKRTTFKDVVVKALTKVVAANT